MGFVEIFVFVMSVSSMIVGLYFVHRIRRLARMARVESDWAEMDYSGYTQSFERVEGCGAYRTDRQIAACKILGLDPDSDLTHDAIKRAYRRKVKEVHPDLGGNAEVFLSVQDAYSTLIA